jgi:hypothetical protein
MIKHIYLIRGVKKISHRQFGEEVFNLANRAAQDPAVEKLSYVATIEPPPKVSIIPFSKHQVTTISIWTKENIPIEELTEVPGFEGVYSVTEALPVAYEKEWKDGSRTPGVCLLTLFKQKKGIDRSTFLDRWHNSHTPMSLKYHPLWHYNRNVVESSLGKSKNKWDGIVEEHMRTRSELMNPLKFFGPLHVMVQRMINVYRDTSSFLDYKTIETYLTAEYWVKS